MKISANFNIPQLSLNKKASVTSFQNKSEDVFVKSSPSFCGLNPYENLEENIEKYTDEYLKRFDFNIYMSDLAGAADALFRNRGAAKTYPIKEFNEGFWGKLKNIDYINNMLKEAGILKVTHLEPLLRAYTSEGGSKVFPGNEIEMMEIYKKINPKEDLKNFPQILLYLYKEEEGKQNPDYSKLNSYPEFLKALNISNEKKILENTINISGAFNGLKTETDMIEAVEYLIQTYKQKLEYLDEILKEHPEINDMNSRYIYSRIQNLIDYLYMSEGGKSLGDLSDYISVAVNTNKIKSRNFKMAAAYFNNFDSIKDLIAFCKILSSSNLSVQDYNKFEPKNIVSDTDLIDALIKSGDYTREIQNKKGLKNAEAKAFYVKYYDLINGVCNSDDLQNENFDTLLKVIDNFEIKDSSSLLGLYNRVHNSKAKQITSTELIDFVNLLSFSNKRSFNIATRTGAEPIEFLKSEKQNYEDVKDGIEKFVLNDKNNYFAGLSTFEIYSSYKDTINANKSDLNHILGNISELNISNESEYKEKSAKINEISQFFNSRKNLFEFISSNEIPIDKKSQNDEYGKNVSAVLNSLKEVFSSSELFDLAEKLSQSKFLINSRDELTDFVYSFETPEQLGNATATLIRAEVPTIDSFNKYVNKYSTDGNSRKRLLDILSLLPNEIKFKQYMGLLDNVEATLDDFDISIKLTDKNISRIDADDLLNLNDDVLSGFLSKMQGIKDGNFIISLNGIKTEDNIINSRYRMANELISNQDSSDKCYEQLLKMFEMDQKSAEKLGIKDKSNYVDEVLKYIPPELYDFVNSKDWNITTGNKKIIPNISLHAKLRIISRFIIKDEKDIKFLSSNEAKDRLHKVLDCVYLKKPDYVKKGNGGFNFRTIHKIGDEELYCVFSSDGKLVTIFKNDNNNR